jgi:glycosyltransferase involved in cell wall biosynthesis
MPKVSVIIPTHNRSQFVPLAIRSVLDQTFKDLEVIVVDDGSTDNTQSVLKSFGGGIRVVFQENSGVSSARNTGIALADSPWVAFLDSDDEWAPNYLASQMEQVQAHNSALCMQTADCTFFGLDGEQISYFALNGVASQFKGKDYLVPEDPFRFVISHAPWQVGSTIFAREAIRRAGLFDSSLALSEDLDFMARVALQGRFGLIRESLVMVHRRNESGKCLTLRALEDPVHARKSNERIYLKLASIETLNRPQRKTLNEIMAANRRAIGNFLLKNGQRRAARASYRTALLMDCSLRSLGRYLLS